ncbi:MAG: flap endonuclease-1 [Candidatus Marsarchaeota archaeon]|nr:flap endonuclease-1 [Candidatus Marsarchaeota archaeon]MCL5112832.1 flap endonuclease-1 [Candidatus Marsarchaeota archaeon]
MSVDLSKLVQKRKITLDDLRGRTIAIDAYNVLYQFLSIIRQPDGTPLMDSKGNVTSHLSGLFYRSIEMLDHGVVPIYVFDGIPSMLKQKTIQARMQRREKAYEDWQTAVKEGREEEARTYAQQATRVTKAIVADSKQLLEGMGISYINAPSEGEAQASYLCKENMVYAVGSQDYDTLLLGAERIVRNMAITGKRKLPRKNIYVSIETELASLSDTLAFNGIDRKQLIWIGMMLGTDFNIGVKGVGPKTALKIAKSSKTLEDVTSYLEEKYQFAFEVNPRELEDMFLKPEVKEFSRDEIDRMKEIVPNKDRIINFMCGEHEFSEDRISKYVDKMISVTSAARQSGIGKWMK